MILARIQRAAIVRQGDELLALHKEGRLKGRAALIQALGNKWYRLNTLYKIKDKDGKVIVPDNEVVAQQVQQANAIQAQQAQIAQQLAELDGMLKQAQTEGEQADAVKTQAETQEIMLRMQQLSAEIGVMHAMQRAATAGAGQTGAGQYGRLAAVQGAAGRDPRGNSQAVGGMR